MRRFFSPEWLAMILIRLELCGCGQTTDWPQFRGPFGNGVAAAGQIPVPGPGLTNFAWRIHVSGAGWSQPIVLGQTIYLTSAVGDIMLPPKSYEAGIADPYTLSGGKAATPDVSIEWKLWAIDLATGHIQWE